MANKNLHDIKIDDLESNKKTPLKNILTLLALLFIILVISVVITKLILNTDSDSDTDLDTNISTTEMNAINTDGSALPTTGAAIAGATAGAAIAGATAGAVIVGTKNAATNAATNGAQAVKDGANTIKDGASDAKDSIKDRTKDLSAATTIQERNLTGSKTKVTLRNHRPLSSVKELVAAKSPTKKDSTSSHHSTGSKKSTSSHHSTGSKKSTSSHHSTSTGSKKSTSSHASSSTVGYTLTPGYYYIKIGTFKDTASAVKQIKKTGLNYKLIKVKNDKTLTRVFIGQFNSKANAKSNLSKAKKISNGAYIIKK